MSMDSSRVGARHHSTRGRNGFEGLALAAALATRPRGPTEAQATPQRPPNLKEMGVGTVSAQRASASKVPEQLFAWGGGPLAQWLAWEERANLRGFRVSTDPVPLEVVDVPAESLTIDVAPGTPGALVRRFVRGERVLLPKHPLNRDAEVAYFS